ncbi:MAG: nicotinate-nucleotide adenylyltransferase [Methylophilaceae bacterium]|nr:nicotinate-nucleotide adenylyltransferase [Methylophilaceae bacterium]
MQAIGILGGTFDPIHFGHLRLAQELGDALGLDAVRFVPAARPPHRLPPVCHFLHRAEMVRLAIADNPLFALDLREYQRPGPSYMVDTLASLRSEIGDETALYLMLGADAFLGLPSWHRWQELFELAHIAVAHRPGHALDPDHTPFDPALRDEWRRRYRIDLPTEPHGHVVCSKITALDISSSALRSILSTRRSARYLMPDAVLDYIHHHHLYSSEAA